MEPDVFNATLISRTDVTDGLALFRVRPDQGVPTFTPGQFVIAGLPAPPPSPVAAAALARHKRSGPRMTKRAYSIASSPNDREALELCVIRVEEGRLTPQLFDLNPGGRLWVGERVDGKFTLDAVPPGADVAMLATGTGLAPFVSMLRTHASNPPWRRLAVVHAVRYATDLCYRDELESYAAADPCIRYLPTATREAPADGWQGLRGRPQTLLVPELWESLAGFPLDPTSCHMMLCGNPAMIEDVTADLKTRGFEDKVNLHFERYW